jgi:type I restriction enzyme S subunit
MTEQNNIQLPKNWKIELLGKIAKAEKGLKPKTLSEKKSKNSLPYIDIRAFEKGEIRFYTDGVKCRICEKNDILLVWDGARSGLCGKAIKGAIGSTLAKVSSNFLTNEFLFYFLTANYNKLNTNTKGIGIPHIDPNYLWNLKIVVPPLPEQHRIIAKIEELFSEIDKAVENLQTARQQLKTYRQSVLKHAFLQPQFKYSQVTLKDISNKIQIGPFGSQLHKSDYISDGIPLINPMHIKDFEIFEDYNYSISKEKQESLPNYILRENDVIMGRRGEMGRVALVRKKEENWFCGTGSLYIRPTQNQISAKYLMYYLGSQIVKHFLEKNAAGTTMTNLNKEIVMNIPVPVCPIDEQHQIVAEIEKRFSEAEKLEESIETALCQTKALRQSILKKAFAGKLVGPDENKAGE